jgi:serine/threonine protein kinase
MRATDPNAPTEMAVGQRSSRPSDAGPPRLVAWSIDHFTVGRRLGWGGMGEVYLARDTSLERTVALKVLREEMASRAEARERFVREARAQARLNSPNVVQIYFVGNTRLVAPGSDDAEPASTRAPTGPGTLYFAMEYVEGESLESMLERGATLEPEKGRIVMLGAARGLGDAARAGLIHRDMKPGNLLVSKEGIVKVADFGLAKPNDPKFGMTKGGTIMGTPHYMAPEQGSGLTLDFRADMYALGCTFYHALAGRLPFDGPNAVALITQHLHKEPTPLRDLRPDLPAPFVAIVERLMKKKREDRFASYEELIAALERAAPPGPRRSGLWAGIKEKLGGA